MQQRTQLAIGTLKALFCYKNILDTAMEVSMDCSGRMMLSAIETSVLSFMFTIYLLG